MVLYRIINGGVHPLGGIPFGEGFCQFKHPYNTYEQLAESLRRF